MAFAHLNGIDLYYEIHGSGDPVLLIHGLGSDAGTWSHSHDLLIRKYRLIVMENRGSGRSSKPDEDYSTGQMADDAAALLDFLNIPRAHVIGKSMGGMIAQFLAAGYPQRVRSLVIACSVMRHDSFGEELLELGRTVAGTAGLYETYRFAFLLSYSREYCMKNRKRLEEARSLLERIGNESLYRGYYRQSLACQKHNSREAAAKIVAPTLVLAGGKDMITPPEASRTMAEVIPNAELRIFPEGGHGFWREFPEPVNQEVLAFLENH